ncbi:cell division protein FtsK [Rhodobacteraceae bacterium]|nr:cell division protein FtsK [Paracoccaceae bacterium]
MALYQMRQRDPLLDQNTQAVLERRSKELAGAGLIVLAVLLTMLLGSYSPEDPSWMSASDAPVQNWLGRIGAGIASPLYVIVGRGAWLLPLSAFIWGGRFILHHGEERAVPRLIFLPIAVAVASVHAALLVPGGDWTPNFGLGGHFGDMVAGMVLGIFGASAVMVKLMSVLFALASLAMTVFVTGFLKTELQTIARFLLLGMVSAYSAVLVMMGRGASASVMAARGAQDRHRLRREDAARRAEEDALWHDEQARAYEAQGDDDEYYDDPLFEHDLQPEPASRGFLSRIIRAPEPEFAAPEQELVVADYDQTHPEPAAAPSEDRIRARIAEAVEHRRHAPKVIRQEPQLRSGEAPMAYAELPDDAADYAGYEGYAPEPTAGLRADPAPQAPASVMAAVARRLSGGPRVPKRIEPQIRPEPQVRIEPPLKAKPRYMPSLGSAVSLNAAPSPAVAGGYENQPSAAPRRTERGITPEHAHPAQTWAEPEYDEDIAWSDAEDYPAAETSISQVPPAPRPALDRVRASAPQVAAAPYDMDMDIDTDADDDEDDAPAPQSRDQAPSQEHRARLLHRGAAPEGHLSAPHGAEFEDDGDDEDTGPLPDIDALPQAASEPHPTPRPAAPRAEGATPAPRPDAPAARPAPAPSVDARTVQSGTRVDVRPVPEKTSFRPVTPADYETPPVDLLMDPASISRHQLSDDALEENARQLENVLEDYGVKGEIVSVRPGPVVTMYELEPAPGLKASRVIGLADDIARSMSALSARVSTVPGRTVIGIELPNDHREKVVLREILSAHDYSDSNMKLPLALGKDIGGEPVIANLAKMPHLLIAGTTGSGKSVAINTMILSLLYKLTPDECRLIMIDPKMLELSVYDGIPHLLSPVVTDPKKAVVALKWVVGEMEDRYRKMSKMGVRNIEGYNGKVKETLAKGEMFKRTVQTGFDEETGEPVFETEEFQPEAFPYIVVVVDEMADLMMVAGKEIEACIQRLAQMARASGIHLIMATQRPSVDVITGTIKANFPTRISFQVTSKIDSRTILGEQGAEQLLGMGDMLYMGTGSRLNRVHGPFVSDEEVEEVVSHLKSYGPPSYMSGVVEGPEDNKASDIDAVLGLNTGGNTGGEDALYDQAVAIVAKDRKCSTSYIQRKLGIGYNKAARLVEQMEDESVVSSANHVGKREILIPEQ